MVSKVRSEWGVGLKDETGPGAASIERNLKRIAAQALSVQNAFLGFGAGVSIVGIAAGLKSVVDYGDRLNDLSKATGATVEQLSFLDYAAKQSGSSLEGLTAGIGKLQKNLADVASGGGKEAAKAFETLGINAKTLISQDLITQLSALAGGLAKIQNPAQRAALAQTILSKSYRDMLPFLSAGSDGIRQMAERFIELGGVLTQGTVNKFDALNDSLVDIETAARRVGVNIADGLAEPLTSFLTTVADAPDKIASGLTKIVAEFGVWLAEIKVKLSQADIATAEGLKNLIPGSLGDGFFNRRLKESTKDLETALKGLAQARENLALQTGAKGSGFSVFGGGSPPPTNTGPTEAEVKERERLLKAQDQYLDGLRKQFVQQGNNTELAKLYADIANGTVTFLDEKAKSTAIALATQLDLLKDAADARKESAEVEEYLNGVVRERAQLEGQALPDLAQKRAQIIDSLRTPLEKYVDTVKELTDPSLGLDQTNIQRGIANARDTMIDAQNKAAGLTDTARELGLTFTSAFEDAVIEGKKFQDVLRSIAQDILRLFVRKQITEPFVDLLGGIFKKKDGGNGGNLIDWFGSLFGNARGGLYQVGGSGGEHPVAFTARRGEYVAVGTGMEGGGAGNLPIKVINTGPPRDISARNTGREIEITIGSEWAKNVGAGRMAPLGIRPPLATR